MLSFFVNYFTFFNPDLLSLTSIKPKTQKFGTILVFMYRLRKRFGFSRPGNDNNDKMLLFIPPGMNLICVVVARISVWWLKYNLLEPGIRSKPHYSKKKNRSNCGFFVCPK